jgi:hypothetical protein
VECLEGRVTPANVSWTGAGDGLNWSDPRNWSTQTRLPGAGDDVTIIPFSTVILHASGSDTVHSLRSDTPILLSGGALDLASNSQINNALVMTGGQLVNEGDLGVQGLNQSGGTLTGNGSVTVLYQWYWSGGLETGDGHTVLQGTAYLSNADSSNPPSLSRIVDNFGVATLLAGSSLAFTSDGIWNNLTGRSFIIEQGANFTGAGQFNNLGLFQVTGTAGARSGVEFDNTDTGGVEVNGGTLTLTTGLNYGTFQISAGAAVAFDNSSTFGYDMQDGANCIGSGTLQIGNSSQVNLSGSVYFQNLSLTSGSLVLANQTSLIVANLTLAGGTVTGTGALGVSTTLNWTSGTLGGTGTVSLQGTANLSGGALSVLDRRTLNNTGTATVANNGITLANNAVFTNQFGYTLNLVNGGSLALADSSAAVLTNLGQLTLTGASTIGFNVNNYGTVVIGTGQSLEVGGTYTQLDGLTTVDGTFTVDNTLALQANLLRGNGVINGDVVNSGELDPGGDAPGTLTINGNFTQLFAGKLDIQLLGPSQGNQYAQLIINGTASLGGTLNLVRQGYVPDPGLAFDVLTCYSHTADFQLYLNLDLGGGRFLDHHFSSDGTTLILQS